MIENIQRYASAKSLSMQDALQVFLQVMVLKNIHPGRAKLIGGTSLVIGHGNPRFSEDVDLTGVANPLVLKRDVEKAQRSIAGLLHASVNVAEPKTDRRTWRLTCECEGGLKARLHIDSQIYPALTQHPMVVEYPGIAPFVFSGVSVDEIMADKLVALAFRRNISGRDLFDLWYHWLRHDINSREKYVFGFVVQKLSMRSLSQHDFLDHIRHRLKADISKRVVAEWERYLPSGFKNESLYHEIFSLVRHYLSTMTL